MVGPSTSMMAARPLVAEYDKVGIAHVSVTEFGPGGGSTAIGFWPVHSRWNP
jgi:hypothetical protein